MLNTVCLMGRMVYEPELKRTASDLPVISFKIAVDRAFTPKGQEKQADFVDIVAWRNTAEFVAKYFQKGSLIALEGSIQTRPYTDKQGNKRTAFEVVANQVHFAGSKQDKPTADAAPPSNDDFEEIPNSDPLPF